MAEENRLKKKGRSRRWWWTVPASADEGCSAGGRQRRLGVFFSIGDVDVVRFVAEYRKRESVAMKNVIRVGHRRSNWWKIPGSHIFFTFSVRLNGLGQMSNTDLSNSLTGPSQPKRSDRTGSAKNQTGP